MPKTKFQSIIFTLIMVFFMVFSMTCYTISLNMGSLTPQVFSMAIREMWVEYVVVFCLIFFLITKTAQKLAFHIVTPGVDKPIFIILAIQSFTVCLIVPTITLFATFLHNGVQNWFTNWLQLAVLCFPVAFCLQIFFVGPLVRLLFRTLFAVSWRIMLHRKLLKQKLLPFIFRQIKSFAFVVSYFSHLR